MYIHPIIFQQIPFINPGDISKFGLLAITLTGIFAFVRDRLNTDKKEREDFKIAENVERQRLHGQLERNYVDIRAMHSENLAFRDSVIKELFAMTTAINSVLAKNNEVLQKNYEVFNRISEHVRTKM